jgi:transketolase
VIQRSDDDRQRDLRAANAIRALTIDATQASGDGHPGMPMGAAPMGWALFRHAMRHDPADPSWWNRDRYVQSAGHGSMLQYALLHLTGYPLTMDDLRAYRQWGSLTPGHPEVGHTPGVETTTGPLGQGLATAVGMALAEAHLAARFNRPGFELVDHRTWVIASDGDLMEGVTSEASSLAGHLKLGKLNVLYDDNHISIDGPTDITFSEDVLQRYEAYGWHVQRVEDGADPDAILAAVQAARDELERPSLIAVRSTIGYGSPKLAGTSKVHGSVLGDEEAAATKRALEIDWPAFTVPEDVQADAAEVRRRGAADRAAWNELWSGYREAHPDEAAELERRMAGELPDGFDDPLPVFGADDAMATRKASQRVLNHFAARMPELMGGSADLAGSNLTDLEGERSLRADEPGGRIVHFGIREHAMAAIANGLALHGGVRPFVATFLVFSDYLRPALRLSALMGTPVVFVFTHDSIGLGGDGPTHQPEAHLASLRAIPNLRTIRPADGNETAQAWRQALERRDGPTALILTRQGLPALQVPEGSVARGGYVHAEATGGDPRLLLLATGSEVALCLKARELLEADGIPTRVVSMPDWGRFRDQDDACRASVLPPSVPARLAVEAAASLGWHEWTGSQGDVLAVDGFGASAPGDRVMEAFGFTPENVAARAKALL